MAANTIKSGYPAFDGVADVPLWRNTTDSLGEAAMWTQRGAITSNGPCSYDVVKEAVARCFPTRGVTVREGKIQPDAPSPVA